MASLDAGSPRASSLSLRLSTTCGRPPRLVFRCSKSDAKADLISEPRKPGADPELIIDGSGSGGSKDSNGEGGGGGGGGDGDGENEEEFGPLMKYADIMRETEARGAKLPADMFEAAETIGLPKVILERYLDLQVLRFQGLVFQSLPSVDIFSNVVFSETNLGL